MLADDLAGCISLDALRTRIPFDDIAVRVQHVNRVVGDALDEEAKSLIALVPRRFGPQDISERDEYKNNAKREHREREHAARESRIASRALVLGSVGEPLEQ